MSVQTIQTSFIAGEISPALFGRQDDPLLGLGAEDLTNFIVRKTGTLLKRSGLEFVYDFGDAECRLEEFRFASDQTLVLIFAPNKLYFATKQGLVLNGDTPYSIDTPYAKTDLWDLSFSQNADVVTITSVKHPPRELRRYGGTDWRIVDLKTRPDISTPSGLSGYATYPPFKPADADDKDPNEGTYDIIKAQYKVTAVDKDGAESEPSAAISVKCNYYITGATVELSWSTVSGAEYYRIYRAVSGIYGFLGQTESTSMSDTGATPDTAKTPPKYRSPFEKQEGGSIVDISVLDGGEGYINTTVSDGNLYLGGAPCMVCSYGDSDPNDAGVEVIFKNGSGGEVGRVKIPYRYVMRTGEQGDPSQGRPASWTDLYAPHAGDVSNGVLKVPLRTIPTDAKTVHFASYASFSTSDEYGRNTSLCDWDIEILWTNNEGSGSDPVKWGAEYTKIVTNLHDRIRNGKWKTSKGGNHLGLNMSGTTYSSIWGDINRVQMSADGTELPIITNVIVPLNITDSQGSGASAEAVAVGGVIKSVNIINGGSNYYSPTVTAQGAGRGARFEVKLSKASDVEYPTCSGQYDQRRVFAGSLKNPLKLWMTNAGSQNLMTVHTPLQDDDRIEVVALSSDADIIRHIVAMDSLILFTGSSELRVFSQSGVMSPRTIGVRAQSYVGANGVTPVVAKNTIVYISARGAHPQALNYTDASGLYMSQDLGVRCSHLFDGLDIVDLALCKTPEQLLLAVSSNGDLLVCNYLPEQQVNAWSKIRTDGQVTSVSSVAEGVEDRVYVMVKRYIGGKYHYYLECLAPMLYQEDEEARCLDCFSEATFPDPVSDITGLGYLEGKHVIVVGDQKAQGPYLVENGAVKLDEPAQHVIVGIPYQSDVVTIPLDHKSPETIMAPRVVADDIRLRVSYDGNLKCSRYPILSDNDLYPCKRDTVLEKEQNERSVILSARVSGRWGHQCQLLIRNDDHLPLEISAMLVNLGYAGK